MRKTILLTMFSAVFLLSSVGFAQLKKDLEKPNISGLLNNPYSAISGIMDPSRMQMNHSLSMSFGTFGGQNVMMNSYVNTMRYQITENMRLTTNLGIMSSPYNTFGENYYLNKPQFFGGAQLDYKINDNASIMFRIDNNPYYYRPTFGGFNNYYYNGYHNNGSMF
ncbi:MAG: hypothetical protein GF313_15600 [Caldithrix sp.]|nr:hypothetical protein [Caldithrix sp.]